MKKILLLLFCSSILSICRGQYLEDFESPNCLEDNGWIIMNRNGGNTWKLADKAHSGNQAIAIDSQGTQNEEYLVTPCIKVKEGDTFSFWARSNYSFNKESFEVYISTYLVSVSFLNENRLDKVEEVPSNYTQYTYDLSAYAGDNIYIAIKSTAKNHSLLYIDDVKLPSKYHDKDSPMAPDEIHPKFNAVDQEKNILLEWEPSPSAKSYIVSVGTTLDNIKNVISSKEVKQTSLEISLPKYNQQYYCTVAAKNRYGKSEVCPI
ncbi:choice-of-anchor J domain-containing protein [Halosquirtibacter laminarini]|uniref:Choice-of-anchor J domain-containing protein n=1 Tax=Halosquirtibacter laminarini TaxID=3374600 RepID=A0AC61NHV9_9BACT|nr:choice-of-anchor J domain-containing protein [Prolixibacteraceae bacterium]